MRESVSIVITVAMVTVAIGDCDNAVSYQWGKLSSDYIKTFNDKTHTFNTYSGMMHSSCPKVGTLICVGTVGVMGEFPKIFWLVVWIEYTETC